MPTAMLSKCLAWRKNTHCPEPHCDMGKQEEIIGVSLSSKLWLYTSKSRMSKLQGKVQRLERISVLVQLFYSFKVAKSKRTHRMGMKGKLL